MWSFAGSAVFLLAHSPFAADFQLSKDIPPIFLFPIAKSIVLAIIYS
jgi:hypothetical protein